MSDEAVEQGDEADEAGASDGASQLIPGVMRTSKAQEGARVGQKLTKESPRETDLKRPHRALTIHSRGKTDRSRERTRDRPLQDAASAPGGRQRRRVRVG